MSAFDGYILCATPRSGSTLLCRMLADTGVAGVPESYFHGPDPAAWAEGLGLTRGAEMPDIVQAARAEGRGRTAVFGLRLMRHSFDAVMADLTAHYPDLATDRGRLGAAFGRLVFIHLRRGNQHAQAVSRVKAEQTGLWHLGADGQEVERLAPPAAPHYDPDRLLGVLHELRAMEDAWRAWFAQEGIVPLELTYEEVARDAQAAVARILTALDLDTAEIAGLAPRVARLADATSADWLARMRADPRFT